MSLFFSFESVSFSFRLFTTITTPTKIRLLSREWLAQITSIDIQFGIECRGRWIWYNKT
jgi:hypothetical protein